MKKLWLISFFMLFYLAVIAQQEKDSFDLRKNEIQLNMTSLVSQFIPFGNLNTLTGPYAITWLKGKNNKFFRTSLGARIIPNSQDLEILFLNSTTLNLAVGYTVRKPLGPKFYIDRSYLAMGFMGSLNVPGGTAVGGGSAIGAGFGFGLGYNINKHIKLSIEGILFLGTGSNGFNFILMPPLGLNLTASFDRK